MTEPDFVPEHVRKWREAIERNIGQPVTLERRDTRRYRITAESDRVRMTVDYKLTSGQGWIWAASTLHVDGERRPLAENPEAFYRLFRDPDSGGRRPAELPPLEPFPLDDPPEDMPPAERAFVAAVRRRFEDDRRFGDAELAVGRVPATGEPGTARRPVVAVQLTTPDGAVVQLSVQPTGIGMRAVRDGFECTNDLDGDLKAAIDALFQERGVPQRVQPGSPGAAREHRAERLTSVEVRRQSVIRT